MQYNYCLYGIIMPVGMKNLDSKGVWAKLRNQNLDSKGVWAKLRPVAKSTTVAFWSVGPRVKWLPSEQVCGMSNQGGV